ncbi:hypothetical protein [Candidatus Poriferisodalis sp.]|uniref:hypothetical protein n=1 Tax=Candidatus Poriferisodalis sp. TaxID=3101277 RepID=UPI003C6F0A3A
MESSSASSTSVRSRHKQLASGVFAFEGDPENDLSVKYSARLILQFLHDLHDLKYIFRDIGTPRS